MRSDGGSPVIVALDASRDRALDLVAFCGSDAGMYKVGKQLFVAEGPAIVRSIVAFGHRVFLDLKFHDIPNTVAHAAVESARLGVSMLTIHASGGPEMVGATRRALEAERGNDRPAILAVTVLTSMDEAALGAVGVDRSPDEQVRRLAKMAVDAGADGLVCSPREIRLVRETVGGGPTIVTPGVRMPGQAADDQKRVATPAEALADGADWIVVGRYVSGAADPAAALRDVARSL